MSEGYPNVEIEDIGKMLTSNNDQDEKVLLYSKLGTLNFDTVNSQDAEAQPEQELSSEGESHMFENMKSI